jgi:probable rRNA maturation factor
MLTRGRLKRSKSPARAKSEALASVAALSHDNVRPRARKTSVTLALEIQSISLSKSVPTRVELRRWVRAALRSSAQLTLRIVDEAEARQLNKSFRRKDYPTNVLTFVYDDPPAQVSGGRKILMGDIILCAPVIEREAREQGKALQAHYAHLTIHGVLHLQGHDHQGAREAQAMEALEIETLAQLGYPNPFSNERARPA